MAMPTSTKDIKRKAITETARLMIARHLAGKDYDAGVCLQAHMDSLASTKWADYAFTLMGYSTDTLDEYASEAQALFDAAVGKKKPEIKPFYAKTPAQKAAATKARNKARKAASEAKAS